MSIFRYLFAVVIVVSGLILLGVMLLLFAEAYRALPPELR